MDGQCSDHSIGEGEFRRKADGGPGNNNNNTITPSLQLHEKETASAENNRKHSLEKDYTLLKKQRKKANSSTSKSEDLNQDCSDNIEQSFNRENVRHSMRVIADKNADDVQRIHADHSNSNSLLDGDRSTNNNSADNLPLSYGYENENCHLDSKHFLLDDQSDEDGGENIFSWLFRRSTMRKSKRKQRSNAVEKRESDNENPSSSKDQSIEGELTRRPSSKRRGWGFKRNASFYRAQRNSVADINTSQDIVSNEPQNVSDDDSFSDQTSAPSNSFCYAFNMPYVNPVANIVPETVNTHLLESECLMKIEPSVVGSLGMPCVTPLVRLPSNMSGSDAVSVASTVPAMDIEHNIEAENSNNDNGQDNIENLQRNGSRRSTLFTTNRVETPTLMARPSNPVGSDNRYYDDVAMTNRNQVPSEEELTQDDGTMVIRSILMHAAAAATANRNQVSRNNGILTNNRSNSQVRTRLELPSLLPPVPPPQRDRTSSVPQSPSTDEVRLHDDSLLLQIQESDEDRARRVGGFWPHSACSMLASLACCLGMSNICRFAMLTFHYGGGFILQFLMLTIVFGLPMISLFMSFGQYMGNGVMDMWTISPVFQGVGLGLLIAMTLIGIYTIVPVSWMFVYFRDSFVTNGFMFKWAECQIALRRDNTYCEKRNTSEVFRRTVPEYFHSKVLQRTSLHPPINSFGELKFENVFNLAVVWMLIFICLSKGIKSYGKVVFAFALFPLIGLLIVSVELLRQAQAGTEYILKMNTYMYDVFTSGSAWVAAGREVFFTWGLFGAVLMQIASHNHPKHNLKRDSTIVILLTLSSLLVAGFLGCACFAIIFKAEKGGIKFMASSFEVNRSILFLAPNPDIPLRFHWSNTFLLGEELVNYKTDPSQFSNFQVFRLITELFPAAVAYLGANQISPFWCILLYLTLITFGLAQQLAIWRCVIEGVIAIKPQALRSWETTITFLVCVMGFVLGLPATTELGMFVLYFLDFCIGSAWWIMLLYLAMILAVFIVRGQPYSSEELVTVIATDKFTKRWLSPVITFSWNVFVPIGLLVLGITSFKYSGYNRMFNWFTNNGYRYWPTWLRQIGTLIQLLPLMAVPIVALFQTCRYLSRGPPDLFDRLQMLYRPCMRTPPDGQQALYSDVTGHSDGIENPGFTGEDPPPKYTPPPSYNTATGLRLLKRFNSLRRSFRNGLQAFDRGRGATPSDVELGTVTQASGSSANNSIRRTIAFNSPGTSAIPSCSHAMPIIATPDDSQHAS